MDALAGLCGSTFGISSRRQKDGLNFGDAKEVKSCS